MTVPSGSGAGTYVVTWNGHGDASALSLVAGDGSLALANSFDYSTWGAPSTAVASGSVDLGFRFLYVGSGDVQWDNDFGLGLEYMHAREYAPALGRFVQVDPSRADHAYIYTGNTPATGIDPQGTWGWGISRGTKVIQWWEPGLQHRVVDSLCWLYGALAGAAVGQGLGGGAALVSGLVTGVGGSAACGGLTADWVADISGGDRINWVVVSIPQYSIMNIVAQYRSNGIKWNLIHYEVSTMTFCKAVVDLAAAYAKPGAPWPGRIGQGGGGSINSYECRVPRGRYLVKR
jgi:RHS repeat-associated protein